jgi:hypothetical protein
LRCDARGKLSPATRADCRNVRIAFIEAGCRLGRGTSIDRFASRGVCFVLRGCPAPCRGGDVALLFADITQRVARIRVSSGAARIGPACRAVA